MTEGVTKSLKSLSHRNDKIYFEIRQYVVFLASALPPYRFTCQSKIKDKVLTQIKSTKVLCTADYFVFWMICVHLLCLNLYQSH